MINDKNPRKVLANELKSLAGALNATDFTVQPDATNPYAFVVGVATPAGSKSYRVIVKELA